MKNLHPYYFQNIQHGYIVDYDEMMKIMQDEHDMDDTNVCHWSEYFIETDFRVGE